MILSLLCDYEDSVHKINVELNLPHHLNYVAALPYKMHSTHHSRETVDLLHQETPDFIAPVIQISQI